jgi:hypothetical protein
VFVHIGLDLGKGPSIKRIEFEHPSGVYFEGLERGPIGTLRSTTPRDDSTDVVFVVCSDSGFDLDKIVIGVFISFPQAFTMEILKILSNLAKVRLVDMDVDVVPLSDLLNEIEGFLEMVECVEEDERWGIGCYL